jgi:hypothetical protein
MTTPARRRPSRNILLQSDYRRYISSQLAGRFRLVVFRRAQTQAKG